jgi:hypothetical protein
MIPALSSESLVQITKIDSLDLSRKFPKNPPKNSQFHPKPETKKF